MGVNKNEVKQKPAEIRRPYFGGADGTQTHDLYDAKVKSANFLNFSYIL